MTFSVLGFSAETANVPTAMTIGANCGYGFCDRETCAQAGNELRLAIDFSEATQQDSGVAKNVPLLLTRTSDQSIEQSRSPLSNSL